MKNVSVYKGKCTKERSKQLLPLSVLSVFYSLVLSNCKLPQKLAIERLQLLNAAVKFSAVIILEAARLTLNTVFFRRKIDAAFDGTGCSAFRAGCLAPRLIGKGHCLLWVTQCSPD